MKIPAIITALVTALTLIPVQAGASPQAVMPEASLENDAETEPLRLLGDYPTVDEYLEAASSRITDTVVSMQPLPRIFFMPAVFDTYEFADSSSLLEPEFSGVPQLRWAEEAEALQRRQSKLLRNLFYQNPQLIPYNLALLPEAPKRYTAVVNPQDHTIEIRELNAELPAQATLEVTEPQKRHWIRAFAASLQFSQAYVSPNWYQGGNNAINAQANILYNVKLNEAYHPNLLFETTVQYKLGINNAPDDSIHAYNISDDLFQVTSTFGIKAWKKWYYSLNLLFKTQLLNSYNSNSHQLRSAFLSPGELNLGLGMTYNYANTPGTVKLNISLAPLSYNMRICTNHAIDPTLYDIAENHHVKHKFGSSAELKFFWQIAHNISYNSRIFGFTNYQQAYADWENTLAFEINKFLTTQIYAHLRYDTATPPVENKKWHKLQVKEILSIGFAYKFSSI